ncbi:MULTISPECIES: PRC-barrel domain-containing protein [Pontibacillus]|uniref:PRC-barrel domain-containing protein n=1 Tax=Pontibacillus chungwhensis TaxID=265426 RepID=A0ABY8V0P3_9BACI|nr:MULTISPECIES: PRC-barrel domain-containing protein [Pontibacillus]MCD5324844.1 PRC-barrel domain-containing protein [Pontibacillus sp. HN14]WIF98802.1 PRC-barrel domain-containing protein [Pontibacillus chungwhensis]
MLLKGNLLEKFHLDANDGELGKVKDLYFDDKKWALRYMVVDTRKWLPGRKVVLSPSGIKEINVEDQLVHMNNDKESIRNSPTIEEEAPVSVQKEQEMANYYGWLPYWKGDSLWGTTGAPEMVGTEMAPQAPTVTENEFNEEADHHLRSMNEIKGDEAGYQLETADGNAGFIDDFIIEDESWKIRYVVVKTVEKLGGKRILISPDWMETVDWGKKSIPVNLDYKQIQDAPEYDPDKPVTRDDEEKIYTAFHRPKYWQ